MANLPVVIFQFAMSPYDNWIRLAWGGALLITHHRAGTSTSSPACSSAKRRRAAEPPRRIWKAQRSTMEIADPRVSPFSGYRAAACCPCCRTSCSCPQRPGSTQPRISSTPTASRDSRMWQSTSPSRSARPPPSSGRPAAASPRCCARSTACTACTLDSAPRARSCCYGRRTSLTPNRIVNLLRARVGMVFQKPTPFPMTILRQHRVWREACTRA
jgi:hypothetical protein